MKTIKSISKTWVLIILFGCMFNLQAGKSVQFKMPDYEKVTIKNGITLYLLEQHEVPLIYISNVFKTGAIYDGAQNGLAYMTAKGLMFGTKNYSKSDIEETFDYIGASINSYVRRESSGIDLSCAKTDLESIIPIWKEMITAPIFLQEEFEKNQKRHLMKLEQDRESPNNVIRSYYNKFIYDDQVYGNPLKGTKSSVSAFTANDLKKFYKQNYSPANMVIIIAGDFNKGEMKKKVINLFEKWQPKNKPVKMDYGKEPVLSKSRVLLVNKEDSRQTTFFIGGMGIKRDNPDYTQIQVINTILGGRFTSWLNDELRVNAGLTYGARSGFSTYKKSGDFAMRT
ncbi:MAG: insulinase family protein, partial [Calditrichia bacterium]|nr:insulinase family protein [Calditrichia bacterium]